MAENDGGPECFKCKSKSSMMWQRNQSGAILCLDCHSQEKRTRSSRSPQRRGSATSESSTSSSVNHSNNHGQSEKSSAKSTTTVSTRRTTRARERNNRAKQQQQQQSQNAPSNSTSPSPAPGSSANGVGNKGLMEKTNSKPINGSHGERDNSDDYDHQRSRRSILLKHGQPMKAPRGEAMIVTSDSIIHKGTTYEIGDIVSLLDRDGGIYYAMVRGFMQDQYAEKYAVLTWLLPRYPNPTHFDPANFILGPEEEVPRSMEVVEFVSHSPHSRHFQCSYFHNLEQAEQWNH